MKKSGARIRKTRIDLKRKQKQVVEDARFYIEQLKINRHLRRLKDQKV